MSKDKRIKRKGAAELLIKRRIGILDQLINEYNLSVKVLFAISEKNKADILTRVKKSWREMFEKRDSSKEDKNLIAAGVNTNDLENKDWKKKIIMVHEKHHQGGNRPR